MNKADARYQKSRAAIVEASIQRLLSNPEASMSEIAIAAGVGRATLYRHFETREELIRALTILCLDETDDALKPIQDQGLSGVDAIVTSIKIIVPMAERFRFLMNLTNIGAADDHIKGVYRRQLSELTSYVEEGKKAGEISMSLPNEWVVASYDALLNAAWTLIQFGSLTTDEATDVFVRSFRASLTPQDPNSSV